MQFWSHKIYQKIKLLKVLFFFKIFRISNEQLPCSAEKFSAGISKLKFAVFVSKDQSKNQTSESSLFFSNPSEFEGTITVLGEKVFGRDIKIDKCSFRRRRSIKKSNFWKFSFFFKFFRTLNEHLPCLAKNFLAGMSKLKIAVFVSKDQSKNQTSESSLFFSNSSELWRNIYCAWRESFRRGYQNWQMQFSSQKINQKLKLLKVLFFFKFFRTLNAHFPCLAKKISAGLSKLKIVLYVFTLSFWGWK